MLILGRKKGEEIVIGDNIVITVREVGADSVKLAVEAPREIQVLRGELVRAAQENKKAAAAHKDIEALSALLSPAAETLKAGQKEQEQKEQEQKDI